MLKFGLKNSSADRCVYVRRTKDETTLGVIHVDDAIFGSNNRQVLIDIRSHLGEEFQIHSLPQTRFIGINISRDRRNKRIFMSQPHVVEKLVERFGMQDVKPRAVPADPNVRLSSNSNSKSEGEKIGQYREPVGALLYLALQTRPDLAYAVGQVARFCQNPKAEHWQAVGFLDTSTEQKTMESGLVVNEQGLSGIRMLILLGISMIVNLHPEVFSFFMVDL